MVNQEQILSHILTTVLELNTEDIKVISNARYRKYSKFVSVTYEKLDRLRNQETLFLCAWRELTNWTMYANITSPSYAAVTTMMYNTCDSVDRNVLRINHALAKTSIATVKLCVTAATVFPPQIDTTSFLKYVSIHLIDKSQLLNFYQNLAIQTTGHKILIFPHADILVDKGVIPDDMIP